MVKFKIDVFVSMGNNGQFIVSQWLVNWYCNTKIVTALIGSDFNWLSNNNVTNNNVKK